MMKTLLCTTALLIAAPAIAQDQPATAPAQPDTATPNPANSATPVATAQPAQPAASAAAQPAQPAAASGSQVAQVINSEFATYDADKSGDLNQAEFAAWMTALKKRENSATGKTMADADISTWANSAFASADKDQNKTVSRPELLTYLGA